MENPYESPLGQAEPKRDVWSLLLVLSGANLTAGGIILAVMLYF